MKGSNNGITLVFIMIAVMGGIYIIGSQPDAFYGNVEVADDDGGITVSYVDIDCVLVDGNYESASYIAKVRYPGNNEDRSLRLIIREEGDRFNYIDESFDMPFVDSISIGGDVNYFASVCSHMEYSDYIFIDYEVLIIEDGVVIANVNPNVINGFIIER